MSNSYRVKQKIKVKDRDELEKLDKQELVDLVIRLQKHNYQLKQILMKQNSSNNEIINACNDVTSTSINKVQRSYDFTKCRKRHVFLKMIYLGWDYLGFATQEHTQNTIEDHLFKALVKVCLIPDRQSSNYHRCGRTDKGVSASSQVISLDIRSRINSEEDVGDSNELDYCKMLNRVLPKDIRVTAWSPVPDSCSARFNCTSRSYKYYFIKGQLNLQVMAEAAGYLVGEHDFRNFCKMDVENGVTVFHRRVTCAVIEKCSSSSDKDLSDTCDVYVLTITANAFLWHQIRCIVSVLLLVGENKETPDIMKHLLNVQDISRKPQYTPAHYIPLILQDCQFDLNPNWRFDQEEMELIILQLQNIWALQQIKASQVKDCIIDLIKLSGTKMPNVSSSGLQNCIQRHIYKPLLERPTCESLENRIEHFLKKRRIEETDSCSSKD